MHIRTAWIFEHFWAHIAGHHGPERTIILTLWISFAAFSFEVINGRLLPYWHDIPTITTILLWTCTSRSSWSPSYILRMSWVMKVLFFLVNVLISNSTRWYDTDDMRQKWIIFEQLDIRLIRRYFQVFGDFKPSCRRRQVVANTACSLKLPLLSRHGMEQHIHYIKYRVFFIG